MDDGRGSQKSIRSSGQTSPISRHRRRTAHAHFGAKNPLRILRKSVAATRSANETNNSTLLNFLFPPEMSPRGEYATKNCTTTFAFSLTHSLSYSAGGVRFVIWLFDNVIIPPRSFLVPYFILFSRRQRGKCTA